MLKRSKISVTKSWHTIFCEIYIYKSYDIIICLWSHIKMYNIMYINQYQCNIPLEYTSDFISTITIKNYKIQIWTGYFKNGYNLGELVMKMWVLSVFLNFIIFCQFDFHLSGVEFYTPKSMLTNSNSEAMFLSIQTELLTVSLYLERTGEFLASPECRSGPLSVSGMINKLACSTSCMHFND